MTLALTSIAFYMLATLSLCFYERRPSKAAQWLVGGLSLLAILSHALLLHAWIDHGVTGRLSLLHLLSVAAWLTCLLLVVIGLIRSLEVLLLFLFPLAALSIVAVLLFPSKAFTIVAALPQGTSTEGLFHILVSILSFCVLFVAGLLAVLLAVQEYLLRHRPSMLSLQKLPSIEAMETLLFQVVSVGFVLLTVVIMTSFYFYYDLLWHNVLLLQKTVSALFAWLIFFILLVGRYLRGWRGRQAIYTTLLGFLLLLLALLASYFFMHWSAHF